MGKTMVATKAEMKHVGTLIENYILELPQISDVLLFIRDEACGEHYKLRPNRTNFLARPLSLPKPSALPTQIRRRRRRRSRSSPRNTRTFMFPEFVSSPCPRRARVPAVPNFANQRYRLYDRCSGKDAISFVQEVGSYWTWARPSKLLPPLSMGPKSF